MTKQELIEFLKNNLTIEYSSPTPDEFAKIYLILGNEDISSANLYDVIRED